MKSKINVFSQRRFLMSSSGKRFLIYYVLARQKILMYYVLARQKISNIQIQKRSVSNINIKYAS